MKKKIIWLLNRIINISIETIIQNFIRRDKRIFLFGSKPEPFNKDYFRHNTKYFFLYLQNQTNITPIWLCDDEDMILEMKKYGLKNVYKRHSIRGLLSILKAKYWFVDGSANQITRFNSSLSSSKVINLWHGIPLKTLGYDAIEQVCKIKSNTLQEKIYTKLKNKSSYYICNCEYEQNCYNTAFQKEMEDIKILGSPRIDVLFHDIPNSEIFMKNDFKKINDYKQQEKKIFIYMPTYRDTGKNISSWLESNSLDSLLEKNNAILLCKLHPLDNNLISSNLSNNLYVMNNESDVYPILKYTDVLITDYSSVYFDYLLLDKPIIYYPFDLNEYQEKCRGFYKPYEELTAGLKVYNEEELINAMQDVINGIDNYKEERNILRNKMFKYQDGMNCERILEFIRSLD